MTTDEIPPGNGGSPVRRPISPFVLGGLFVVALALAVAGTTVLGLLRPPATRSAALAPSGSVFYASVFVEPSVGQRRALGELADRSRLSRILPDGDVVAGLVDPYLSAAGLDYASDVEPWLGREAGLSVAEGRDGALHVTVFVEARDPVEADEHLAAAPIETRERTYRDADHRVVRRRGTGAAGGWSFGMVGDFVVVAKPPAAFDAVVDAARGTSLADDRGFEEALDPLPDDRLLAAYIGDPALATRLPLPPLARGLAAKLSGGDAAFTMSFHAESDALVLAASRGEPVRLEADVLASLIQNLPIGR